MVLLRGLDERRSLYHVNVGIPLGLVYIKVSVCILRIALLLVVLLVGRDQRHSLYPVVWYTPKRPRIFCVCLLASLFDFPLDSIF